MSSMLNEVIIKILKYSKIIIVSYLMLTIFFFSVFKNHVISQTGELIIDASLNNYMSQTSNAYLYFNKVRNLFGNEESLLIGIQPKNFTYDIDFLVTLAELTERLKEEVSGLDTVQSLTSVKQFSGKCSDYSYFHKEIPGSVCQSVIKKYLNDQQCLMSKKVSEATLSSEYDDFEDDPDFEMFAGEPFSEHDNEEGNNGNLQSEANHCFISSAVDAITLKSQIDHEIRNIIVNLKSNQWIEKDILSSDTKTTGIVLQFKPKSVPESSEIQNKIDAILESYKKQGYHIAYAGMPRQVYQATAVMRNDIKKILPISLLLMIVSLFFSFRSLKGVFLPIGVVLMGVIWTLGIFSLAGQTLNPLTMVVPPLLICVGSAYIIFTMNRYFLEVNKGGIRKDIIERTIKHVSLPLSITAMTTIAGFAALMTSPISSIRSMGLYSCIGVFIIILLSLTFVPAVLSHTNVIPIKIKSSILDRLLGQLSTLVSKYHRHFVIVWLIIGAIAFVGLFKVKIFSSTATFNEKAPIMEDLRFIEDNLAGTNNLRIVFSFPDNTEKLLSQKIMQSMLELKAFLLDVSNESVVGQIAEVRIDKVYSPSDALTAHYGDYPYQLEDKEIRSFFNAMIKSNNSFFISSDKQYLQMMIRMKSAGSSGFLKLKHELEQKTANLMPELEINYTGSGMLLSNASSEVARSQIQSIMLALLIIFIILSVLFMSPKLGLLALYPNIITIGIFFGMLGWFNIPIDMTISVIAAIVLGIGVDDTIHFLADYNKNIKLLRNKKTASELTIKQIGRPATFTTVALAFGFGVFVISEMDTQVLFGSLVGITLVICWLADINFLPSVMVDTRLITLWDYTDLRYTPKLLSKIPIFNGLTIRETKLAVLMSYMKDVKAGEIIFNEDNKGNELHVILEGKVIVYTSHKTEDEKIVLATLSEGRHFGEMGIFRKSKLDINTQAVADTSLLVIDSDYLKILQKRYPLIASKLFINLAKNLFESINITVQKTAVEQQNIISANIENNNIQSNKDKLIYNYANIFQNFNEKQLNWFKREVGTKILKTGTEVYQANTFSNLMIILLTGSLETIVTINGTQIKFPSRRTGDMIGWLSLLCNQKIQINSIKTLEESTVIDMSFDKLMNIITLNKKIASIFSHNMVSMLSDKFSEITELRRSN